MANLPRVRASGVFVWVGWLNLSRKLYRLIKNQYQTAIDQVSDYSGSNFLSMRLDAWDPILH